MTQLQLFDSIQLKEPIALSDGDTAPTGAPGAIVEIFNDGEAYLVELFGDWVKLDKQDWIPSQPNDPEAFRPTIGVETVYPQQLQLVHSRANIHPAQPVA